jgi:hypothetical protein
MPHEAVNKCVTNISEKKPYIISVQNGQWVEWITKSVTQKEKVAKYVIVSC